MRPLEEETLNRESQIRFSLLFARVLLAGRDPGSGRTLLETVLKEAEAGGFAELTWEARMTLAKMHGEAGDPTDAKHQLQSFEEQERGAGFLLLARKTLGAKRLMWSKL